MLNLSSLEIFYLNEICVSEQEGNGNLTTYYYNYDFFRGVPRFGPYLLYDLTLCDPKKYSPLLLLFIWHTIALILCKNEIIL